MCVGGGGYSNRRTYSELIGYGHRGAVAGGNSLRKQDFYGLRLQLKVILRLRII